MTRFSCDTPIEGLLRLKPECRCGGCGADNVRKVISTGIRLCNACEDRETSRETATDDFLRVPGMDMDLDPMFDCEEELCQSASAPIGAAPILTP